MDRWATLYSSDHHAIPKTLIRSTEMPTCIKSRRSKNGRPSIPAASRRGICGRHRGVFAGKRSGSADAFFTAFHPRNRDAGHSRLTSNPHLEVCALCHIVPHCVTFLSLCDKLYQYRCLRHSKKKSTLSCVLECMVQPVNLFVMRCAISKNVHSYKI